LLQAAAAAVVQEIITDMLQQVAVVLAAH